MLENRKKIKIKKTGNMSTQYRHIMRPSQTENVYTSIFFLSVRLSVSELRAYTGKRTDRRAKPVMQPIGRAA